MRPYRRSRFLARAITASTRFSTASPAVTVTDAASTIMDTMRAFFSMGIPPLFQCEATADGNSRALFAVKFNFTANTLKAARFGIVLFVRFFRTRLLGDFAPVIAYDPIEGSYAIYFARPLDGAVQNLGARPEALPLDSAAFEKAGETFIGRFIRLLLHPYRSSSLSSKSSADTSTARPAALAAT